MKTLLIAASVLAVLVIALGIYMIVLYNKMDIQKIEEHKIQVNQLDESVGKGYTNIALFGGDSRTGQLEKYINKNHK